MTPGGERRTFVREVPLGAPIRTPAPALVEDIEAQADGTYEVCLRFLRVPAGEGFLLVRGFGSVCVRVGEPVRSNELLGFAGVGEVSGEMVRLEWAGPPGPVGRAPVIGTIGSALAAALAATFLGRRRPGRPGQR